MKFSHFFIDRPIFATVLSVVLVIIGGLALWQLPIALYPEIAPPTVLVRATYPGANAKVVADTVATPIEQEVNGVEDMLYMSSQSTNDGTMALTITFKLGTDLDKAQVQVQNRVALAEPRLPEEVRRLGISTRKRSPDLTLVVNLVSPDRRYDNVYLSNYALLQVRDVLSRLPGVGDVTLFGAREYSMRMWLNPEKVASRGLTAGDVVAAIREQNVQVAAGVVGQPPTASTTDFQFTVTTKGRLTTEEEFSDIIIKTGSDGQVTRVGDVARVELGARDYGANLYLSGEPTIGMGVFQLPGTNALETKRALAAAMETLKTHFPQGLDYRIIYDTTIFVEQSIRAVVHTLLEAIGLVVLVVLIFLQNWRASIIPLLAVPVSLIGTFAVMSALGVSLNTLSLFGLVLAIGIVVDDAIVVVENVERNMALGLNRRDATRRAMEEVTGPIIATTLVLSAVFIPTAFLSGVTGVFFRQFALTIAVSTVISTFNSLTLSPALCALILQQHTDRKDWLGRTMDRLFGWFFRAFNRGFGATSALYVQVVGRLIRRGTIVLVLYGGLVALGVWLFQNTPGGFIPQQDQGYLITYAQLPDAASLQRADTVARRILETAGRTPGVQNTVVFAGFSFLTGTNQSNAATIFVILEPFEKRRLDPNLSADHIAGQLRQQFGAIQEAFVAVFPPPPVRGLSTVGGFKLQIEDRGSVGLETLEAAANQVINEASQQPGLVNLFTTFRGNVPQFYLDIDRTRAKSQGVRLSDLFDTLQVYLGSLFVNDFNLFGRTYQVTAQADAAFRLQPKDIPLLKTRNERGEIVPLGALLQVQQTSGPDKVVHYNLYPSVEINGATLPGVSTGQAIGWMEQIANQVLPAGMAYEWTELTYQQILAGNTALLVFPLCVLLVFLTLAAQYESWSLPLAVILIVPMSLLCAVSGVWIRHYDNNIFTQVALVVLVGLASKNAILIVEFARARQSQGLSRGDAAIEASRLRMRPILMTSFAFIFGVWPLVVSTGAAAEGRRLLGTVVFSGMLGVTLFGLLFTPVFYVIVRRWVERRKPSVPPSRVVDHG